MQNRLLLMKTVTSLHVGTGRSGGYIDLEIAREKATGWPVVPGSSVKGVLRSSLVDTYEGDERNREVLDLFGEAGEESQSGAICCADLRTLFFPVQSFFGCFAYVTSPLAVRRFVEMVEICSPNHSGALDAISSIRPSDSQIFTNAEATIASTVSGQEKVFLEDLDFQAERADFGPLWNLTGPILGIHVAAKSQVCMVSDTVFTFLCETCTEVNTKVTLNYASKTAKKGGLRNEEAVPSEAVMYGLIHCQKVGKVTVEQGFAGIERATSKKHLQFGGKSTTGQGLCRVALA